MKPVHRQLLALLLAVVLGSALCCMSGTTNIPAPAPSLWTAC